MGNMETSSRVQASDSFASLYISCLISVKNRRKKSYRLRNGSSFCRRETISPAKKKLGLALLRSMQFKISGKHSFLCFKLNQNIYICLD